MGFLTGQACRNTGYSNWSTIWDNERLGGGIIKMKFLAQIILIAGILSLLVGKGVLADQSLQAKIDAAPKGSTIKLTAGVYQESIHLNKPIKLISEKGAIFKNCSSKPIITIKTNNVTIRGITVDNCSKAPAIYISGNDNKIENLTVYSTGIGLKLENANYSLFKNIHVSGHDKENGFDLYHSAHNQFYKNTLDHVQDGFYMEYSDNNNYLQNTISHSRYGIHVMFSDSITLENNLSKQNYSGAMVMGSSNSLVQGNKLIDNNQNVNALGLFLYDVHQSLVKDNQISNNRLGLFVDSTSGTDIQHNQLVSNFIGAQLIHFQNNHINNNTFIGNISEIQASGGTKNNIEKNYWDGALTLDTDGNGLSNIPYKADPYFLNLINDFPSYQIFFQDPGILLLQKMLKSPSYLIVTDKEPLIRNPLKANEHMEPQTFSWMMSLIMIFCSLFIMYIGRNKR